MRKAPLALAAAAVLGLTAVAAPSPAEARLARRRIFPGGGRRTDRGRRDWRTGFERLRVWSGLRVRLGLRIWPGYGGGYEPAYYGGYYGGGYAPAYYGGGYYGDSYPVVRYRRVVRPAYAYYGGPRYYGPRYHRAYYRRW